MGLLNYKGSVLFVCTLLYLLAGFAAANVVLIGRNVSLSFDDVEANFAPAIKGSGECGVLYLAEPLDACTPLTNKVEEGPNSPFVLIIRGECAFKDKVRYAQNAGFKAAIVYDNEDSSVLIPIAGTPGGIHIHAVFVSKASGEILKKYAGCAGMEFWIIPTFEKSAWSIVVISFILLLAMSAVLATSFFVRRHCIRLEQPRVSNVRGFHGMSSRLVKAMPSIVFTCVLEDNCTSSTCAICLEDYGLGEKLRVLPCRHRFHALCVDSWLTAWRTFCPVCKQDARAGIANLPASECSPLLSSGAPTPSSAAAISSFHSSAAASPSPNMQIASTPWSESSSWTNSLSIPSHIPNALRSYTHSPAINISRSSSNLSRNSSSHRSPSSHMASSHSLGFPLSSPIHSRFTSPHIPNSSNASPSYLAGSSSRQSYLWHCSDSGIGLL